MGEGLSRAVPPPGSEPDLLGDVLLVMYVIMLLAVWVYLIIDSYMKGD